MMRVAVILSTACLAMSLAAQEADETPAPRLQVSFEETEAIPGQPLSLRLTVLVPTFMPQPPVWPSLEAPNLLVRLPEGSTGPTSERIGGETWAGVTRHYRVSPMVPGHFEIPSQTVIVFYADAETNEAVATTLATEALTFAGIVPEGAEGLDPFIAAAELEVTQEVEGDPAAMTPGDSVTRTVTARIRGTSPMFLPDLLRPPGIEGVAAYEDEPAVDETDARGVLSGTRIESMTLVAESGGAGEMPAVAIRWYNLASHQIETATVEGVSVAVDGPPARNAEPPDWRAAGLGALAVLLVLALAAWLLRPAVPPLRLWLRRRREAWRRSERHAHARLRQAIEARDLAAVYPALDAWAQKMPGTDPRRDPKLCDALARIGASRYGPAPPVEPKAWRDLSQAIAAVRRITRIADRTTGGLPALNPGARPVEGA